MTYVLDVSNYDLDTFDAACLKDAGVTGVIVGCQRLTSAEEIINRCRVHGIKVHALYGFLYFGVERFMDDFARAVYLAERYGIEKIAVDVESSPPNEAEGVTPARRIKETWEAVRFVESGGYEPVIYTYAPYWQSQMGNTTEFSAYTLWLAHYLDNEGSPFERRHAGFGGWDLCAAHQWTSTLFLCGRHRDANHLWEGWFDDMTAENQAKLDAVYDALVGQGNPAGVARLQAWNANGNSLLDGYTIEQKKLAGHTHQFLGTGGSPEFREEDLTP